MLPSVTQSRLEAHEAMMQSAHRVEVLGGLDVVEGLTEQRAGDGVIISWQC
jgi:hypothetical protein